jgi:crossover junction endodeoxyribonuclease RusA
MRGEGDRNIYRPTPGERAQEGTGSRGEAIRKGAEPLTGPVTCRMIFTLARPDGDPKTKITYPDSPPDLSKLIRSTEDALTKSGIWEDDARVIDTVGGKRYPNEGPDALHRPGCIIELRSALIRDTR